MRLGALGADKRIIERLVFLLAERAVYIVVVTSALIARLGKGSAHVKTVGGDNRCRRVIEAQMPRTDTFNFRGQSVRCQRTCGDNDLAVRRYIGKLLALELNERVGGDFFSHERGKLFSVNRQSAACGNRRFLCALNAQGTEKLHLCLESACGGGSAQSLEGV